MAKCSFVINAADFDIVMEGDELDGFKEVKTIKKALTLLLQFTTTRITTKGTLKLNISNLLQLPECNTLDQFFSIFRGKVPSRACKSD